MTARRALCALAVLPTLLAASLTTVAPPAAATGGSITIYQQALPTDGGAFEFTGCLGAGCGSFELDDDDERARPDHVAAAGLAPGTYTITQAVRPNWELTEIHCTGGSTTWAGSRLTIVLGSGEDVICSFTNRSAYLSVAVDTRLDSSQDFGFTGCAGSACGTFALDDDAGDPTLPAQAAATGLALGTYTITQRPSATATLERIECGPGAIVDLASGRVVVTIESHWDQVRCTFYETTQSLRVVQDTLPDGGQDVGYTGCLGSGCGRFTLDDDADPANPGSITADSVAAGTYTITQDEVPGLELAAILCPGEAVDLATHRATVLLSPGESATCTFSNRRTATALTGATQISAGYRRTCAVVTDEQARCWGTGALGDGREAGSSTPVVVSNEQGTGPLTGVVQVSAGAVFSCAVLATSEARCWGANHQGQLGNGTTTDALRPTPVLNPEGTGPLTGVLEVSAGFATACARLADGEVRCWGYNQDGTLGGATPGAAAVRPIVVLDESGTRPLAGVTSVGVGVRHVCVSQSSGEARCWGQGEHGELGQGQWASAPRPVAVTNTDGTAPLSGVSDVEAGWWHTCAHLGPGEVACWGMGEGLGMRANSNRPVTILEQADGAPLTGIRSVTAGWAGSCATTAEDEARCWGLNDDGVIGDGTITDRPFPVPVLDPTGTAALVDVVDVSSGFDHACALLGPGEVRCWGANGGQLGDGTFVARRLPVPVVTP